MTDSRSKRCLAPIVICALAGCAVRLGGPKPEVYEAVAMTADANADATATAQQLLGAEADLVLISTERDSAWLSSVAAAANLTLSGPGRTSGRSLALMTNLEVLGDTSLVLSVPGGGRVHMHDALYKVDEQRLLDLMIIRFDEADARSGTNTLLGYIATDVGGDAALMIAVDGPTAATADSVASIMRATLSNTFECGERPAEAGSIPMRLLYGPSAQLACLSARVLPEAALSARVEVQR